MPTIPAMTTEEERQLYYRLARDGAAHGAVVEIGAWLGASSAFIAAGVRDSGIDTKAHVYDRFVSKPGHAAKVKAWYANHAADSAIPMGACLEQFRDNLGPLIEFVEPHQCEIEAMRWDGGPISVLITDAPKRVPQISHVLTALRDALQPGAVMAWQDFCHFPSYEIPACLYRLRDHIEFVEAVVPGTTLAFRVVKPWDAEMVSPAALAVKSWQPEDISDAWGFWHDVVPTEKGALFECGATMFLCDIGWPDLAVLALDRILLNLADQVAPKWRYLHRERPSLVKRYRPLFELLHRKGLLG